jgi:glycosyltransferase involved in cell wall biosynthesis
MRLVSVIVPFGGADPGRRANLLECLDHWRQQRYSNFELILVEQSLDGSFYPPEGPWDRYISIRDPHDRGFNLSWCRNVGARQAIGEMLVLCDADIIIPSRDYLAAVSAVESPFSSGAGVFIYSAREQVEAYRATRDISVFHSGGIKFVPFTRNACRTELANGGVVLFQREWFLEVFGGYNENFFCYGWEDTEAARRIRFLLETPGLELPRTSFSCIHLFHEAQDRSNQKRNELMAQELATVNQDELCARMRGAGLGNPAHPILV